MTQKIHFVGDVHGELASLDRLVGQSDSDLFIQVGDLGAFWNSAFCGAGDFSKPVHFIGGNHENWDVLDNYQNFPWPKNLNYVPRATHWDSPITTNFLGGAESIDKARRALGVSWWPREIPSYAEFDAFGNLPPAEIIVTHTAPHEAIEPICFFKNTDPTSHTLQAIWEQMTYVPKLWFFGHFHQPIDVTIRGTRFICLPCIHDHWHYTMKFGKVKEVPIKKYLGATVTVDNGAIVDVRV